MVDQTRLIDLLVRWEELHNQGTDLSPEEVAADCPELAGELKRRIDELRGMDRLLDTPLPASRPFPDHLPRFPRIAGYEILAEIGRGGMGVVYQARQEGLHRLVALKMILAGRHAQREDLARFRVEAEAVARLQHPNIVQIHEIGEQDGLPFFSLEYVDGGSLAEKLASGLLPFQQSAGLVEALAHACHHAHLHGVVHRDLKPANILLARSEAKDDRPIPRITDFGLAKRLDEEAGPTRTGAIMGTPSYMAPEQASGAIDQIGPLTDVYALGAILYEMLTGRAPFRGASVLETLEMVRSQEPVPVRRLQPGAPADLETICLKCLEKEQARRYPSALALAEDLRRYQAGEPIIARPTPWHVRLAKWARRRPAVAALLGALVLVTVLGFTGVTTQWLRAKEALESTERARQAEEWQKDQNALLAVAESNAKEDAKKRLGEALTNLYFERIARVDRELGAKAVAVADRTLDDCQPTELRGWEWHYLKRLCHADRFTYRGHHSGVLSVAYSPDDQWIVSGSSDGTVHVWNPATGKLIHSLKGHNGQVFSVAVSKDGKRLASASADRTVRLWDVDTGAETATLRGHTELVASVAFSPDGSRLASCGQDGTIRIWDVEGNALQVIRGHGPTVSALAYSPDGLRLASAGGRGTVKVWNTEDASEVLTMQLKGAARSIAYRPDGKQIASGSSDFSIRLWDAEAGREQRVLMGHSEWVKSLDYSPDGKQLASASYDKTVMVWDSLTGAAQFTLRGHIRDVVGVAFRSDGKGIASASLDGTVKIWNNEPQEARRIALHKFTTFGLAFGADGRRLISTSGDKTVRLHDLASGETTTLMKGQTGFVASARRPDGLHFAAGGAKGGIHLWDAVAGREEPALGPDLGGVRSLAYHPTAPLLAAGYEDGRVIVWNLTTRQQEFALPSLGSHVRGVAYSPDGRLLATTSARGDARLWDAGDGKLRLALPPQNGMFAGGTFSPCGRWLTTADMTKDRPEGPSGRIRWWDVVTGEERQTVFGHAQLITALVYSPDGKRLATASWDRTVRLWDVATGRHVLTLRGHAGEVICAAFSPDGRWLASGESSGAILLWDGRPLHSPDAVGPTDEAAPNGRP